jgi:hypothetical protein
MRSRYIEDFDDTGAIHEIELPSLPTANALLRLSYILAKRIAPEALRGVNLPEGNGNMLLSELETYVLFASMINFDTDDSPHVARAVMTAFILDSCARFPSAIPLMNARLIARVDPSIRTMDKKIK